MAHMLPHQVVTSFVYFHTRRGDRVRVHLMDFYDNNMVVFHDGLFPDALRRLAGASASRRNRGARRCPNALLAGAR